MRVALLTFVVRVMRLATMGEHNVAGTPYEAVRAADRARRCPATWRPDVMSAVQYPVAAKPNQAGIRHGGDDFDERSGLRLNDDRGSDIGWRCGLNVGRGDRGGVDDYRSAVIKRSDHAAAQESGAGGSNEQERLEHSVHLVVVDNRITQQLYRWLTLSIPKTDEEMLQVLTCSGIMA